MQDNVTNIVYDLNVLILSAKPSSLVFVFERALRENLLNFKYD